MEKTAFMFSGQGAQFAGMGRELYESFASVRRLFDEAEAIRKGTLAQMFFGSEEELKRTENTQPCLYLADLAPALALCEEGRTPAAVAGFSLGEIPALAFAGAFSFVDGFGIACDRGRCLGEAAKKVNAAMYAVMKLDDETVERLCEGYEQVYPVNYNCPGQLVVSGELGALSAFSKEVTEKGGRCVPLKVGGAFHSPFMDEAAEAFAEALKQYEIKSPRLPVYSNLTGKQYEGDVRLLMRKQVNHPVRWSALLKNMAEDGISCFIETGVGDVLKKLAVRTLPECTVSVAGTKAQLAALVA